VGLKKPARMVRAGGDTLSGLSSRSDFPLSQVHGAHCLSASCRSRGVTSRPIHCHHFPWPGWAFCPRAETHQFPDAVL